jgi:bacterioferritin (cytochrome b1)
LKKKKKQEKEASFDLDTTFGRLEQYFSQFDDVMESEEGQAHWTELALKIISEVGKKKSPLDIPYLQKRDGREGFLLKQLFTPL